MAIKNPIAKAYLKNYTGANLQTIKKSKTQKRSKKLSREQLALVRNRKRVNKILQNPANLSKSYRNKPFKLNKI